MTDQKTKELQAKAKHEVDTPAEPTRPGLVFNPEVDIFETAGEIILLADIPGVASEDLNIDLKDSVLTLTGNIEAQEGNDETPLSTEYETGQYYRQFNLSEVIDQDRISAKLDDGVLRLTLPKVDRATPRKIPVSDS